MSKQIYEKSTFLIRIDRGWWKILSGIRTETGMAFKALVEQALADMYTGLNSAELEKLLKELKHDQ